MLSKINLIIKLLSKDILVVKTIQNNKWEFPFLFSDNNASTIINSILKTVISGYTENIKSITYLFENTHKPYKESTTIPIIYYEIITKRHTKLSIYNSYFYFRYYSTMDLNALNDKVPDIKKYLTILEIQKKERKNNIKIYNSF